MAEWSGEPALEARSLAHRYGERTALAGVSVRIRAGEIFGFLGPNGGGKTTLFRILATLARPSEGDALVAGTSVLERPREARRALGVVFQSPSIDLHLTVEENLVHHGHLYGLRGKELRRLALLQLERFALTDRQGERAGNLSGGLRRRLEIAKAMLHRPRILLMDEPSAGLDPGARRDLWSLLERLRDQDGVAVALTTHFMEEGDRCDRLALLDRGRIIAEGTPSRLKDRVPGNLVLIRAERASRLAEKLEEEMGLKPGCWGNELRLHHEEAHELGAKIGAAYGDLIESLTIARPTLEDVFVLLTGHGLIEGGES